MTVQIEEGAGVAHSQTTQHLTCAPAEGAIGMQLLGCAVSSL